MLKKTISYVDYNGIPCSDDFYFNLSKPEIVEMEYSVEGGFSEFLTKIARENNPAKIIEAFKLIVLKAYGEKSADGKRFLKSREISEAFFQTGAYEVMFMEFIEDPSKFEEFVNAVVPRELVEAAASTSK